MEEAPFIADWRKNTSQSNVVVVPFFIADGLHSYQDIPVLLGIESAPTAAASQQEVFRRNPYLLDGRTLYYASAIGTEPLMADVILDTIERFDRKHLVRLSRMIRDELARLIKDGYNALGELEFTESSQGYLLYHWADRNSLAKARSTTRRRTPGKLQNTIPPALTGR